MSSKLNKCLCCMNLTLATRLIAAIGLVISVILAIALIHDKSSDEEYYTSCINVALALGLDLEWFHVKSNNSTAYELEEHVNIIVMISYSFLYLFTNLILMLATILLNKYLTYPWLICEMLHCLSKFGGLIYHCIINNKESINKLYITGTIVYMVLMAWWWLVVFFAQRSWNNKRRFIQLKFRPRLSISLSSELLSPRKYHLDETELNETRHSTTVSVLESPTVYNLEHCYPAI